MVFFRDSLPFENTLDFKYRLDFFCFSDDTDYKDFTGYYSFSRIVIIYRQQKTMGNPNDHDIQELKRQNQFLEEQLMQAQRLTALGELTGTTAHEFNNILTTIINYAQLGLRHKDEPTRTKSFDKILLASKRAAKIANTVLATARNRKKTFEPTNLIALVEDALLLLEREMNKYRIAVEKSFQKNIPEVMADGNQIQQVLLNLLINARQAMPNGGRIVLKISYDEENEMIDFVVRDYGCGIPTDKLPRIFDRFYTTKSGPDESGKGGSGLGLASCKSIIEQHKGLIRVESTEGKGTAFIVKLPTIIRSKLLEELEKK
ncbi:MAG: sensor histidine kinase [Planctomycetaceae bacterium]|jgi:signal transduction histidine kinase|nr:sensor histidine kinase [Planctomycetaceae bacterium]